MPLIDELAYLDISGRLWAAAFLSSIVMGVIS